MRFLRNLFWSLVLVAIVAIFLAAAAISPVVQTWVAQYLVGRQTGGAGSVDSFSARFGHAEIDNLKLNFRGAQLTVPHLEAELPVAIAVREHRLLVTRLVAKDWTLDLSKVAVNAANAAGAPDASASQAAPSQITAAQWAVAGTRLVVRKALGALGRLRLPYDLTLDGVELEGDVLVPMPEGRPPAKVHVKLKGGGVAAGRDGSFELDAASDLLNPDVTVTSFAIRGHLTVALLTPRTIDRVETESAVTASGGIFGGGFAVTVNARVARAAGADRYALDLRTGDERHLVTLTADHADAAPNLSGTWKIDLQDADVAQFLSGQTLPAFTAAGGGTYEADAGLTTVRAAGHLGGTASRLDTWVPALAQAGAVAYAAEFAAEQLGRSLRFDRAEIALHAGKLYVAAHALQPFVLDETSGLPQPTAAAEDWVEVAGRGIPPEWFGTPVSGYGLAGGAAAGDLVFRLEKGTVALRSKAPVTAADVSLVHNGKTVARRLDLTLGAQADFGPAGWHFQAAPLKVASEGQALAELAVTAARAAAADAPLTFQGTWTANLLAPALRAVVPGLDRVGGRSAEGDFSGKADSTTEVDAKVKMTGRDPHRTLAASVHAAVDDAGRLEFTAPVKMAFGARTSDLSIQGTVVRGEDAPFVYLKLTGKQADLGQLRLLGGATAAFGGVTLPAGGAGAGAAPLRDQSPFWGGWSGRVLVSLDHVYAGTLDFAKVDAAGDIDAKSIKLEGGRADLGSYHLGNLAGGLTFDSAAGVPYRLDLTLETAPIEVGSFFPSAGGGLSPAIEGQFTVAAKVTGVGMNLADLLGHTTESARLTSTAGIVRVFKTDVDEALPVEKTSSAGDAAGRIGAAVGTFFGAEGGIGSGRRKVAPATQAALDVINNLAEIGYDQAAVTVEREPDGTIKFTDLAMTAGDLHVTGAGAIAWVPGLPLPRRPLRAELQVAGRGRMAKLFGAAGLLSDRQDAAGFTLLAQPLAFGGTPSHIDNRAWHERLVKSAERGAEPEKPMTDAGKTP